MTKAELIDAVAQESGELTKANVQAIVEATFEIIARTLKKDKKFTMTGFGTFVVRKRKGRIGRNPRTGEVLTVPPSKTVGFKPSVHLKSML